MNSLVIGDVAGIDSLTINPARSKDDIFFIYTLPGYDNDKKIDQKKGRHVKSARDKLNSNTILFNKLNVRFKRIWNIDSTPENSLCSSEFIKIKTTDCDQKFLYYFLNTNAVTELLVKASGGTSHSHSRISPEDLLGIKINFPSIDIQKNVATFISALDSKIELNKLINSEFELLLKTVFDYWFIQFDFPDENGKPYKSSKGKMLLNVDLKKVIPEGWKVSSLSSIIKESKNGDWGQDKMSEGYSKCFCIRGADINGLNGTESFRPPTRYINSSHTNRKLKADDLIIEISGGSPTQSTGRMAHISQDVLNRLNNNVVCSNFCKAISLKNNKLSYIISRYWTHLYDSNVFFNHEGKTSGIKNLLFDQLVRDVKIALPEDNVLVNNFYNLAENIDIQRQNNLAQNQQLVELRDWLLPMLMNGQVKIN